MMTDEPTDANFDWRRGGAIALAVTAFLIVFRPFGVTLATPADWIAALGFAPLNFLTIMLVHRLPDRFGPVRALPVIGANILYAIFVGGASPMVGVTASVLIAALTAGLVGLWNRERRLADEVVTLRAADRASEPPGGASMIVLRGENDRDILKLQPHRLEFIRADGNYAEVHFQRSDGPTTALLRASLKSLAAQCEGDFLTPCHRSYLVNLAAADRLSIAGGRMTVEFPSGKSCPVSRRYRDAVRARAAD